MLTEGMFIDDRYEIVGKIGAGGMSDVYKAKDHTLGRFVAIKVLKQEFSEDVNFVTKFRTEAQSAAGLEHPNIVNIYDVGSQEGMYYIIMEYVEGITLKTYIEKKGQLTFKEAISIAIQVGRGIEAAHKKNIIHRDIKPQNIMISTEGKVKVMDFGIARAATSNTINSDVMGSVHYSSPEQARNGFVDGRSDIYSLGIVMYEMVTGRVPFDGDTTVAVAIQHLQEEMVAPSAYAPNLPVSLEKIILKCTQADPNDRYQNCTELMYALEHYDELDDSYRKKNKKKLGIFAATVALAVVSGITAGIGYSGMQRIKLNNYNQYIENGMNYCREENYEAGTAEFKKAIELDGSEEKAYEQYIQAYIDATNKAEEAGTESTLNLDDALTLVSNRISSKHGGVEKNSAVLYKLALTYFEEERSYSQAAKYFGMIDEKDEEYGKLAGFYKSISELRSDSTSDASELMQAVNDFATYNENNFTNQEATKFVNYRIIGEIYSTNVSKDAETSIAEQASTVMEQAVADLDEYTGNDLDEEAVMDMNYRYDDNLIMIYEQLAKENADNETVANGYYSMAISYCEDYIGILKMKVDSDPSISLGGSSVNAYNQSYYNKMMTEARCYDAQGKTDDALKIYEAAEKVFGTKNEWSDNVYAEHLDYLYRLCEAQEQDPKLWTTKIPDLTKKLIQVFDDGGNVLGIDSNKTWYKRKDTLQMLKDGSYDISEEEATQAPDANSDDSQSAEMGE